MGWIKTLSLAFLALAVASAADGYRLLVAAGVGLLVWQWRATLGALASRAFRLPRVDLWRVVPRVRPGLVYLEGPPGAGKTYSLDHVDWQRVLGHASAAVPEAIPPGVLADFYNKEKQAIVGYTFEHYMVAVRTRDEMHCRAEPRVVHLCDRTRLGSFVFHVANYVAGNLTREQASELEALDLVQRTLTPLSMEPAAAGAVPDIVIVYYAAPFALCHERVIARHGADEKIGPRYHALLTFVYAYVIAHLVETRADVGFLVDAALNSARAGHIDYGAERQRALEAAHSNLDIVLMLEERARFDELLSRRAPADFRWEAPVDGRTRGRTVRSAARAAVASVAEFGRAAVAASEKKAN